MPDGVVPTKRVSASSLQEGNVLMCLGNGGISRLIALVEGGLYSHAAYYAGGGRFIHATTGGVRKDCIGDLGAFEYVDAYEHKTLDSPSAVRNATAAAQRLVERPYDEPSLWMLAVIVALRDLRGSIEKLRGKAELLQDFARSQYGDTDGMTRLGAALRRAIRNYKEGDEARMTCTEVVTTAFANAASDGRYALEFDVSALQALLRRLAGVFTFATGPPAPAATGDPETEAILDLCDDLARAVCEAQLGPDASSPRFGFAGSAVAGFSRRIPLNMVTPFDVQHSPSLRFLGRVHPGA